MRDYKLRKKVFNNYPDKEEVAEMIESSGGGSGSGLVCRVLTSTNALDHTWNEINSAMRAGKNVVVIYDIAGTIESVGIILTAVSLNGGFGVVLVTIEGNRTLSTNSADGYPKFSES